MNRHSLYVILCSTGSQRSCLRAGFTWSRNDKCMMTRAAAFITRYRGLKRLPSQQSSTPRRRPAPALPAVRHPISFHATAPINCRNASGTIAARPRGGLRADFTHHQSRPPPPTTAVIDCWSEMCANRTLPLANARSADKITRRRQMFD